MRRAAPRMGFHLEYILWIFTRLSALALLLLALAGAVGALAMGARSQMDLGALMRWTFLPNSFHVINSNIPDITQGWSSAFWKIMQLLVVFFGASHGMNGLRVVIEDYLSASWRRSVLRGLVFCLWLFILVVAIFVILRA